jgi:hypothetical protein
MNALFDTEIFEDILFERGEMLEDTIYLLDKVEKKRINGWISASSIPAIYALGTDHKSSSVSAEIIRNLLLLFRIATVDEKIIHAALQSGISDLHLALISESAKAANLDCIVSNNRHFREERNIRIMTPKDVRTIIEYSGM